MTPSPQRRYRVIMSRCLSRASALIQHTIASSSPSGGFIDMVSASERRIVNTDTTPANSAPSKSDALLTPKQYDGRLLQSRHFIATAVGHTPMTEVDPPAGPQILHVMPRNGVLPNRCIVSSRFTRRIVFCFSCVGIVSMLSRRPSPPSSVDKSLLMASQWRRHYVGWNLFGLMPCLERRYGRDFALPYRFIDDQCADTTASAHAPAARDYLAHAMAFIAIGAPHAMKSASCSARFAADMRRASA